MHVLHLVQTRTSHAELLSPGAPYAGCEPNGRESRDGAGAYSGQGSPLAMKLLEHVVHMAECMHGCSRAPGANSIFHRLLSLEMRDIDEGSGGDCFY